MPQEDGGADARPGSSVPPDAELDAYQRGRELGLLEEAARLLAGADSLDEIHAVIVRAAALIVATSRRRWRASFLALEGDHLRRAAVYDDAGIDLVSHEYPLERYPTLRRVIESGQQMHGDAASLSTGIPDDVAAVVRRQGVAYSVLTPVAHAGEVFGILGLSTRDVTGHGDIPVKRLASMAHLGALAIANSRHIVDQRRVVERAQAVERAKTRFLNLAAHELRGPISVLRGYLSMLSDGSLRLEPPEAVNIVSLLLAQAGQINRVVEGMLETTRLEEGQVELRRERIDLREAVGDVVSIMAPLMSGRVRLNRGDDPLLVEGDRIRLGTVLMNLLDNAGKYSPPRSPIDVMCAAVGDGLATVSITDRGIGLSDEELAVLFTRFGRIPSRLTSHIPGTGLGLWISREIARLHGGDIDVRSAMGEGSTFTLVLPLDGGHRGPGESLA